MSSGSHHHQSSAVAAILNPTDGFRGAQAARGVKPKNHMKANLQNLRQT